MVYPEAVSLLPGGHIWSLLFFLMLLALGFGTQFSIVAAIVTIIKDAWPREWGQPKHRNILIVMCLLMFLMGLTMITNGGMYVLQLLDNHAGTFSALFNGIKLSYWYKYLWYNDELLQGWSRSQPLPGSTALIDSWVTSR